MLNVGAGDRRLSGGEALEYEEPRFITGAIYGRGADAKKLLFRLEREARRSGETLNVRRDYTYPDGRLAAQEQVVYEGNDLVLYELKELQTDGEGSARIRRVPGNPAKGRIEFEYTSEAGSRTKRRTEGLAENTLINDMVGPFLISHWAALVRGQKVQCRYLVVPRRESVGFTFVKDSEAVWEGRKVIIVKMEASSIFVSALIAPLFFTIEMAPPHRVLQYEGRTTPMIEESGRWKDLDAVTVFDWESAQ
jgi:hypothetical protein